uniref:U4/U6 small nuclear ribonucleoprotein Prp31 n=1 Tax=Panagrolaimus davidi TaxID=227884 RepID=A0A914QJN7_9BILA
MLLAEDLLADVEEDGDEDMEYLMPKEEENDDEITEAQLFAAYNRLAAEIDQEVQVIHIFIRDKYEKRKPLEPEELEIVIEACDMAEAIQEERVRMHQYVEQGMALVAPSSCAIVGAGTVAMLVSQSGGLGPLAKQPACNLQILGKQNLALAGFSTASILSHAGFIYFHPIVQTLPPDYRQKATMFHPIKTNRMNFGELQENVSQEDIGFTLGQAASTSLAGGGRIRESVVDNKTRVKQNVTQKMQRQLERHRQQIGGGTSIRSKLSGTQSNISFTPVQGLEIVIHNRDQ